MPQKQTLFFYLLFISLLVIMQEWDSPLLYLHGDSRHYIEFTDGLMNGSLWNITMDTPLSGIVRTPGYPVLLLAARVVSPEDFRMGLFAVHLVVAITASILMIEALRPFLPPLATGSILLLFFSRCQELFPAVMTEWSAIAFLLTVYASLLFFLRERKFFWLFFLTLTVSSLILIRPVFSFLLLLPLVLFMKEAWSGPARIRRLILFLTALAPLLIWAGANLSRLNSASLSPAGALSFFGVTSALAAVELLPDDPVQIQTLFTEIHKQRHPVTSAAFQNLSDLGTEDMFQQIAANYGLSEKLQQQLQIPWPDMIDLLQIHNQRVIRSNGGLYARYVVNGLFSLKLTLMWLIPSFLVPLYLLKKQQSSPVAGTTLIFLGIHLLHVIIISCIGIIHTRYYNLTFFPLICVSLISTGCFVRSLCSQTPKHPQAG